MTRIATHRPFDLEAIRRDFPILKREVHGKPLVYLDNAATSQKPVQVIAEITRYYRDSNANIHRGVHTLSQEATEPYEGVREKLRALINAPTRRRDRLHRSTTESLNLVAHGWARHAPAGRRRGGTLRDRAPLEHRAVADAARRERHRAALHPDAARRHARHGRGAPADRRRARGCSRSRRCRTRSARSCRSTSWSALAQAQGALVLRRWRAERAAHARGRAARSAPTSSRSRAHKMLGPTGTACCGRGRELLEAMTAVHGRRRHDPHRQPRAVDVERHPAQVRGGHAEHRGRDRASARRSTTCSALGMDAGARARGRAARVRAAPPRRRAGRDALRPA